jgi:hypothetical protein
VLFLLQVLVVCNQRSGQSSDEASHSHILILKNVISETTKTNVIRARDSSKKAMFEKIDNDEFKKEFVALRLD